MTRQEYARPRVASGMEARRAETGGGFVPAFTSGSVHDSPTPADGQWLAWQRMLGDTQQLAAAKYHPLTGVDQSNEDFLLQAQC